MENILNFLKIFAQVLFAISIAALAIAGFCYGIILATASGKIILGIILAVFSLAFPLACWAYKVEYM
jgi:hypothetical protein